MKQHMTTVEVGWGWKGRCWAALRGCDDHFFKMESHSYRVSAHMELFNNKKGKALARGIEIQAPTLAM